MPTASRVVLRWERPIYALVYRTIGREEDARDLCQETFLRAFRALPGFPRPGEVLVVAVEQDRAESVPRLDSPRAAHAGGTGAGGRRFAGLAAAAEPSESIEDLVARKDLSRAVERAMGRLPEEQRTAIVLKEYHGLTFQEIAELVGCPLSTVKTRLYQGLRCCAVNSRGTPGPDVMTETCRYPSYRDEAMVALLCDDILDAGQRRYNEAHVLTCAGAVTKWRRCGASARSWLAGRRRQPAVSRSHSRAFRLAAGRPQSWWRTIPAWAQVARRCFPRRLGRHRQPRRSLRPERAGRPNRLVGAGRARAREPVEGRDRSAATRAWNGAAPWRADWPRSRSGSRPSPRAPARAGAAPARASTADADNCAACARCSTRARSGSSASWRCASAKCCATSTRSGRPISCGSIAARLVKNKLGVEVLKQRETRQLS